MPEPAKLKSVRKPREPVLSSVERRAYQAAWRILGISSEREYACTGRRRSERVDQIAAVIAEELAAIVED